MIAKGFTLTTAVLAFFFLFSFPQRCSTWVLEGFESFLYHLFPALFLPMVLSAFLFRSPIKTTLERFVCPVISFLYKTKREESLAFLFSLLCGYPTGLILLKEMYSQQKLSLPRYQQLCLFCNNCGLGFLFSYAASLFSTAVAWRLFLSQLSASFVIARLSLKAPALSSWEQDATEGYLRAFFGALKQSVASLSMMGATVIFFRFVLSCFCEFLPVSLSLSPLLFSLVLELSSACRQVQMLGAYPVFCAFAMGWGGLCVWAQSRMVTQGAPFPKKYLLIKGINALLCGIFYLLFSSFIL